MSELSGGTQRRLSIAVSLINDPSLCILDEPTVGIDAILRNEIWHYLVEKCRQGMTIIIVTHYIEEAANSNRVGLMRNGRLLAEDDPKRLMATYQEPNLEAVFLKLCCFEDNFYNSQPVNGNTNSNNGNYFYEPSYPGKRHNRPPAPGQMANSNNPDIFVVPNTIGNSSNTDRRSSSSSTSLSFNSAMLTIRLWILVSLVYRNLTKFFYSHVSIIIILLPATQALIYCLAVSKNTVHVRIVLLQYSLTATLNPFLGFLSS